MPRPAADGIVLPRPAPSQALLPVYQAIVTCERCPRLRAHCQRIATVKKAAFRDQTYWGRPVPGFGDPNARVLLIGLAPAAHGANRTGRVFTGDGPGGSGDFLMRALHVNGLATQPTSRGSDDGLRLTGAYIVAAARCAPPENKPTPEELERCRPFLEAEWKALPKVRVVVCLGRIAFDICWRVLADRGFAVRPRPAFAHGGDYPVPGGPHVLAAFHPSRQNTNTGRLTPAMLGKTAAPSRELTRIQASVAGEARDGEGPIHLWNLRNLWIEETGEHDCLAPLPTPIVDSWPNRHLGQLATS